MSLKIQQSNFPLFSVTINKNQSILSHSFQGIFFTTLSSAPTLNKLAKKSSWDRLNFLCQLQNFARGYSFLLLNHVWAMRAVSICDVGNIFRKHQNIFC